MKKETCILREVSVECCNDFVFDGFDIDHEYVELQVYVYTGKYDLDITEEYCEILLEEYNLMHYKKYNKFIDSINYGDLLWI